METTAAANLTTGNIIKTNPIGSARRFTYRIDRVTSSGNHVHIDAHRAKVNDDGSTSSTGGTRFLLLRPTDQVEVVR